MKIETNKCPNRECSFTKYFLLKTRFCQIFLHKVITPNFHKQKHDHPWSFISIILWGGYLEKRHDNSYKNRKPLSIAFRSYKESHDARTDQKTSWSLVIAGPKRRVWGFVDNKGNRTLRPIEASTIQPNKPEKR